MATMRHGRCRVIMVGGVLLPGMAMPTLPPPPPDPHPNKWVQRMREEWDMRIIAWDGVFMRHRPRLERRMGYVLSDLVS